MYVEAVSSYRILRTPDAMVARNSHWAMMELEGLLQIGRNQQTCEVRYEYVFTVGLILYVELGGNSRHEPLWNDEGKCSDCYSRTYVNICPTEIH